MKSLIDILFERLEVVEQKIRQLENYNPTPTFKPAYEKCICPIDGGKLSISSRCLMHSAYLQFGHK